MTWKEQLGKVDFDGRQLIGASYRGVPFFVESHERTGGRRTVTKEFPLRDKPHVEDLGRAARAFPVEGYVLGDDYLAKRDALLAALEDTAGPGQLQHPSYGTLQVICTGVRVRESKREGGIATFGIEFAETEAQPPTPTAIPDAAELVEASADAAAEASAVDFDEVSTIEDEPQWTREDLAGVLTAATAAVDELLSPVMSDAQALADLRSQLDALEADALHLVGHPLELAAQLQALWISLTDTTLLDRLLRVYEFEPSARPEGETSNRARQGDNYDAQLAFIRRGVAIQAARLAPAAEYDSYEDAVGVRDAIADALDEQLDVAGDTAFPALQQLRADLVRAVPGEESDLAHLVHYTPPASVPSLVLAHRLYGDIERESDIISRNHVQNPAFILGGQELEVLSSG